jgi:putative ABC transport system permease protein
VKAIDRKLVRDLRRMKAQIVSIAAVVACGVASVITMRSTLDSIQRTRDDYYSRARFPDVFASLKRAPDPMAARIAAIPGVATVETRVVATALLTVPGLAESAQGYIISVPDEGPPLLNAMHVRRGAFLDARAENEVMINEHFAEANAIGPGDSLGAVINGRLRQLRIVGIALSPEFIHNLAPGVGQFSDNGHQGILWMRRNALGPLYGMDGAFNDVSILLANTASERGVIAALDALLAPYGGGHAYGRKDQPSNRVVAGEIEQLRVFGTAMPLIFLFVAAYLLNVVLSRLIATQREEIAMLKSFGYSNLAIARHFLGYPVVAVALGSVGGILLGIWVGRKFTALYAPFFRFPSFEHHTSVALAAVAVFVSGAAAVIGAMTAVRAAIALPPAEGMRPIAPAVFKPLLLERLGWGAILPPAVRMVMRNLERRPLRTALSVVGVALAAAILVTGEFAFDSARYMSSLQFRTVERGDLTVAFTSPREMRVANELGRMPGVMRVELFRAVPVTIRSGQHSRQIAITGLEPRAELRRLVDRDRRAYVMPPDGLVLTKALSTILGTSPGDTVTVELTERGGEIRRTVVAAELDELLGLGGYMTLDALTRLTGEAPSASGAYLRVAATSERDAVGRITALPGVATVATQRAMLKNFDEQIAESLRLTVTIVVALASVVALGVIYNGIRISLSERSRELASLRVLGFTRREVAALLFGEQGVIDVLGAPLGLLLGLALAHWIIGGFDSELYRLPVVVTGRTYLFSLIVIAAAAITASLAMRRRIYGLDLVAVLKARE